MAPNFRALVRAFVNSNKYKPATHDEYEWARTCARKVWFKAEEQADRAAARRGLKVYKCRFCEWWHLARRRKKEGRS